MIDRARAAELALSAAIEAASLVMRVYGAPFEVEYKAKDDPVTAADREANALLCERLAKALPGVPIVAEESEASTYAGFGGAEAAWFVDPVDGTREFVARTGEFAVMVGLAERGRATLGAIVAPALGRTLLGVVGEGAWEVKADGTRVPVHVSRCASLAEASVVVSRSRTSASTTRVIEAMAPRASVPCGSSGLKGALVALGVHDVYLQTGHAGLLWDACATEALVVAAGGLCTDGEGGRFDYAVDDLVNRKGMVATNGALHEAVLTALRTSAHA